LDSAPKALPAHGKAPAKVSKVAARSTSKG
jgi:hypothetical protein